MTDAPENRRGPVKRHPCQVTADRLKDDVYKYGGWLSGAERDDFAHVIFLLEQIADGSEEVPHG